VVASGGRGDRRDDVPAPPRGKRGRAPDREKRVLHRVFGPAGVAAISLRLPLVLTEADSHLGVTNRLLAPFARRVCLAFPLPGREGDRYRVTGRPIPQRSEDRAQGRARFGLGRGHQRKPGGDPVLHSHDQSGRVPGRGQPDAGALRVGYANLREHLQYIGWLAETRKCLAGSKISLADFAAAAHLSCLDFLGDVPWDEDEAAKHWYQRMKSRPAFRPLLADRLPGFTPAPVYADLDF